MGAILTWPVLIALLVGIFFGSSIKAALNKAKAKV